MSELHLLPVPITHWTELRSYWGVGYPIAGGQLRRCLLALESSISFFFSQCIATPTEVPFVLYVYDDAVESPILLSQ